MVQLPPTSRCLPQCPENFLWKLKAESRSSWRSGYGFSHEKTTHHFHLLADRGAIEIRSNEPADADDNSLTLHAHVANYFRLPRRPQTRLHFS